MHTVIRMRLLPIPCAIGLLFCAFCEQDAAAESYQNFGPVEKLDNGVVELKIAPRIGRIVSFRKKGGEDWLHVVDEAPLPGLHWNPWGGDRVWPTAQGLSYQIYGNQGFDPVIDGQPWEVLSKSPTAIELRSGFSPQLGISITRKVELLPGRPTVISTFQMERKKSSVIPVHFWTVTGIRTPEMVLMESDPHIPHEGSVPFKWWRNQSEKMPAAALIGETRVLRVPLDADKKLGTFGTWIAALAGDEALLQTISFDSAALYLEESNLQTYYNVRYKTCELETLSPSWFLAKGKSREWQVRWELATIPKNLSSDQQKAGLLQQVARELHEKVAGSLGKSSR